MIDPITLENEDFLPLINKRRNKIQYTKKESVKQGKIPLIEALEYYILQHADFRERTIQDYRNHVKYLQQWASTEGIPLYYLSDINENLLQDYYHFLLEMYSPNTVNIRINTFRAFLNWCFERNMIGDPLHKTIKKLKVDEESVRFFSDEQIQSLLEIPDRTTFTGFRNYCIMVIMLDNGIRINELLSLTFNDVSYSGQEIRLSGKHAKTPKFRRLPLDPTTLTLIKKLEKTNKSYWPQNEYLFVSVKGKKLDASTIRRTLREYGQLAGIQGSCSPHMFRHSFARLYILGNGNPLFLQQILGHSTLEMTKHYVRLFSQDIINEHKSHSPIRKLLGTRLQENARMRTP